MVDMHFHNSYSYVCLAILIRFKYPNYTQYNDLYIADEIGLPYLFLQKDEVYIAGGLIQTPGVFNLLLNKIYLKMIEEEISKEELLQLIKTEHYMFKINNGTEKHCVVNSNYSIENDKFYIYYPGQSKDGGTTIKEYTASELALVLDDVLVVSYLKPHYGAVNFDKILSEYQRLLLKNYSISLSSLKKYSKEVQNWTKNGIKDESSLNHLFYVFFNELPDMFELIKENNLSKLIKNIYTKFNNTSYTNKADRQELYSQIIDVIDKYSEIIKKHQASIQPSIYS